MDDHGNPAEGAERAKRPRPTPVEASSAQPNSSAPPPPPQPTLSAAASSSAIAPTPSAPPVALHPAADAAPPATSAPPPAAAPPPLTHPSAILVSRRQQGNPVLRAIRNVAWQYMAAETTADFVLSDTSCALFLSLRYHLLHPDYLERRLRELSPTYTLRLVLLYVDTEDTETSVLQVTRAAAVHECTAVLAWSVNEAARYLETFRAYAKKPADQIKERCDGGFLASLAYSLTTVRPLNKADVATLHAAFGSLRRIVGASAQELSLCPGLGQRKVAKLREAFTEPFVPASARGTVRREAVPPPVPAGVATAPTPSARSDPER